MRPDSTGGKNLRAHAAQTPVSFMPLLNAVGEIFFKVGMHSHPVSIFIQIHLGVNMTAPFLGRRADFKRQRIVLDILRRKDRGHNGIRIDAGEKFSDGI